MVQLQSTRVSDSVRVSCKLCARRCRGQVLQTFGSNTSTEHKENVPSNFFHLGCFICCVCSTSLLKCDGYFSRNDRLFCPSHYQQMYGAKCNACGFYLSGETVNVLGKSYHSNCLLCISCSNVICSNERIGATSAGVLCNNCCRDFSNEDFPFSMSLCCAGCGASTMSTEETILALGSCYHPWCFNCSKCDQLIDGVYYLDTSNQSDPDETTAKKALCARCYKMKNNRFCHSCLKVIEPSSKRVELGDGKFTFHPDCAKCHNCWLWFVDGEKIRFLDKSSSESPTKCHTMVTFDVLSSNSPDQLAIVHEDCSQSLSRKFIESSNLHLPPGYRENYQGFKKFIEHAFTPGVRRSWTFSQNAPSIQAYLPKFGSTLYPTSYLDPRRSNAGTSDSLYCRFVSPDPTTSTLEREEKKSQDYQSLKFHDEKLVDCKPVGMNGEPIYPKEVLFTINKSLPKGVNRKSLEAYLSNAEFFSIFSLSKSEFYLLPTWKQIMLKKIHNLF